MPCAHGARSPVVAPAAAGRSRRRGPEGRPTLEPACPFPCHVREQAVPPVGVALLVHGRDGAGAVPHMIAIAEAYLARGWRVVAPDLPHSRATPASGSPTEFTMTGHLADAAKALAWTRGLLSGDGRELRVALAGHSLGAYAAASLAVECAGLDHLLAVSPVLSGAALLAARRAMGPAAVEALRREAPRMLAEMEAHDAAAPALAGLAAPVAVITGAEDGLTPPRAARAYFGAAREGRFYSVLPGQHHCPEGPEYTRALIAALDALGA